MRFLFDQTTDRRLAPYLQTLGHDVLVVAVDYPPALPDYEVLAIARKEGLILITEDRDFGELIFRLGHQHAGVIYLRVPPMELAEKIVHINAVLINYADQLDQFIVVSPRNIRVRRLTR